MKTSALSFHQVKKKTDLFTSNQMRSGTKFELQKLIILFLLVLVKKTQTHPTCVSTPVATPVGRITIPLLRIKMEFFSFHVDPHLELPICSLSLLPGPWFFRCFLLSPGSVGTLTTLPNLLCPVSSFWHEISRIKKILRPVKPDTDLKLKCENY